MAQAATSGGLGRRAPQWIWRVVVAVLLLGTLGLRIPLVEHRQFDPDELEHLHGAWCIDQGQVPYRDYFEHHTPWLHYLLSGLFPLWGSSLTTILVARYLMLGFTVGILALTVLLGRQFGTLDLGLLGALLLSLVVMFVEKTVEIRPDVPAVVCWLAAVVCLMRARRQTRGGWSFASGALAGAAVMFTPKALFALGGLALALVWQQFERAPLSSPRNRWRPPGVFALGFCVPILLTWLYFAAHDAGGEFIHRNFVMNAQWKAKFWPWRHLEQLLTQNPAIIALGLFGWAACWIGLRHLPNRRRGDFVLALCTTALVAGLWVIPVPYRQYYQLVLPLWALHAAAFLWRCTDLPAWRGWEYRWLVRGGIAVALCLHPWQQMREARHSRNDDRLGEIRYLLETTALDDRVLDGWTGSGVFRPHAYYYFFLHHEVRAMLTAEELGPQIVAALETNRPVIVIYDGAVRSLAPDVRGYIEAHYAPTGVGALWRRKNE